MGLKDELVAATTPPRETVEVGGVTVWMRGLGIKEKFELAEMEGSNADQTFWLLEHMVCDSEGKRLFTEGDEALRGMDDEYIAPLATVAQRLLGVEASAKNSDATPSLVASQG